MKEAQMGLSQLPPMVGDYPLCQHIKKHRYYCRDEADEAQTVVLALRGWFNGTGYCPAYLPRWLGESLPTLEEETPDEF